MRYIVFLCEAKDLAEQLNTRDPKGLADVLSIHFFGSAVHVVLKVAKQ